MPRTGLKIRILAVTVGIILALGLVLIVFVRVALYKTLCEKLQKRGVSIAKHVGRISIEPLLTRQFAILELMVRDLKKTEEDIEYIIVLNARGEVVAHTFNQVFPSDLMQANKPASGEPMRIQKLAINGKTVFDISVPLLVGSAGTAHVGISEASVRNNVDEIIRMIAGIIAIILIVGVGFAAALSAAIIRPLSELASAAHAVEGGVLSTRVSTKTNGEIGVLSRAFNRMIEAREKAEQELRKSEKMVRDITANLGEGVMVIDGEGCLLFMNPEAERLLGWTEQELMNKDVHSIIHCRTANGAVIEPEECPTLAVLKTGGPVAVEDDVYTRKDGTTVPVSYISAPIREAGVVVAAVMAFRDITKRKQIEADRDQLILAYQDALDNVKTLKGLMPICSSCKRIRDDKGYWNQIESYIREHSEAEFSHGLCPECAKRMYPNYYKLAEP